MGVSDQQCYCASGIWAGAVFALDKVQVYREEKPLWAYNKDYYQKALLRRDWYLKREEETLSKFWQTSSVSIQAQAALSSNLTLPPLWFCRS